MSHSHTRCSMVSIWPYCLKLGSGLIHELKALLLSRQYCWVSERLSLESFNVGMGSRSRWWALLKELISGRMASHLKFWFDRQGLLQWMYPVFPNISVYIYFWLRFVLSWRRVTRLVCGLANLFRNAFCKNNRSKIPSLCWRAGYRRRVLRAGEMALWIPPQRCISIS